MILTGRGVVVPVSADDDDEFTEFLGVIVADGASALVLKSWFPEAAGPAQSPAYAFYQARYKDGKKALMDGNYPSGLPTTDKSVPPSTVLTRYPGGVPYSRITGPVFRIGQEW